MDIRSEVKRDETVDRVFRAVLAGGGVWVGMQETIDGPPLVLFNSPTTGTTLAISLLPSTGYTPLLENCFDELQFADMVRQRIQESDAQFADRKVSIKQSVLKRIANTLLELSTEIDEMYLRREKCPTNKKS